MAVEGLRPGDPEQVGKYRLLNRLGVGGMGQVFLGQSPSGRLVAVKIIRAELADDAAFRQRFAQEVTAARRVGGMFTAPVVDADPDAEHPWMVTAYVAGPSLVEAVATRGPLPVRSVLMLAAGLAEGLGAVHAVGLVHRDLKPSNVLLASDGPRIIDFGISWSVDAQSLTRVGGVIGSPGFMSPEQAEGTKVGPASDIFSLGSVLAFAATGDPPFGEGSPSVMLYRVVHEPPAIGNVPAELQSLIERCLVKDPAARPSTEDLLTELGYPEPNETWLGWPDGTGRDADTSPTERGPFAVPAVDAGAMAVGGAAGLASLVPGELAAAAAPADLLAGAEVPLVAAQAASDRWASAEQPPANGVSGPLAAAPAAAGLSAGAASLINGTATDVTSALAYYQRPTPPPGYEHGSAPTAPPGYVHSSPNGAPGGYEHSSPNGSSGGHEPSTGLGALLTAGHFDQGPGDLPPNDLGPDHRRRRRLLAVVATVVVLAAVAGAGAAFDLMSRHTPAAGPSHHGTKPSASAPGQNPSASAPTASPTGSPTSQPTVGAVGGPGGGQKTSTPSQSPTAINPGQVVLNYITAINDHDWSAAWALGGDNLYPTMAAMQVTYANVISVTATIKSVTGDSVVASVQRVMRSGPSAIVTQNETFQIVNGVITSETPPVSAAPGPNASVSPAAALAG